MLKPIILENGFSVDTANDCEQANRKIREKKPDLIVLDLVLPDASGMDFCSHLKQNPNTRLVPIIMCTANAISPQDKVKGLDIGADDYLTKPFEMKELVSRIKALLRRSELFEKEQARKEQQPAAPDPGLAAQEEAAVPTLGFWQIVACAFIRPQSAFRELPHLAAGWNLSWIIGILSVVALFRTFTLLAQVRIWDFLKLFFMTVGGEAVLLLCASVLAYGLILLLFRKRFPFRSLVMALAISSVPLALAGLLSGIYVFLSGQGASLGQFSAGLGLWLPPVRTPAQEALSRIFDLFTLWPAFLAVSGLAEVSRLPKFRLGVAVLLAIAVPIGLTAVR
jgi:CheY-like chemotaxis protein